VGKCAPGENVASNLCWQQLFVKGMKDKGRHTEMVPPTELVRQEIKNFMSPSDIVGGVGVDCSEDILTVLMSGDDVVC
jgi:hypothetical protein